MENVTSKTFVPDVLYDQIVFYQNCERDLSEDPFLIESVRGRNKAGEPHIINGDHLSTYSALIGENDKTKLKPRTLR